MGIVSLIIGFTGAFFSLLISRWSAKRMYGVVLIDDTNLHQASEKEQSVYRMVKQMAGDHHIKMPEV